MSSDKSQFRLQRINAKGMEIATTLAELLAGKDVSLEALSTLRPFDDPTLDKEARLRAFLTQINAARVRLGDGDSFGRCLACEQPLADAALDEYPWLERCVSCLQRGQVIVR